MTTEESIDFSREDRHIPEDEFDRHMKKARENDISSRKKVFVRQSENNKERIDKPNDITPSVY